MQIKKIITIKPYKVAKVSTTGSFTNQKVVFTGFRNKDWEKFIQDNGGTTSTSVSKNTTLLVYNDGEETSSKYITAVKLGVKTINKTSFAKKYNL